MGINDPEKGWIIKPTLRLQSEIVDFGCVIHGDYILIFGGINRSDKKLLNSIHVIDLRRNECKLLDIKCPRKGVFIANIVSDTLYLLHHDDDTVQHYTVKISKI